jgi:hypothetical protein
MVAKWLSKEERPEILGTFKPVGHVLVALPNDEQAGAAGQALRDAGFGYEVTLMRKYQELARDGCGWLLVYAPDDERAAKVADVAQRFGARAAEKYHRLVVEDLL